MAWATLSDDQYLPEDRTYKTARPNELKLDKTTFKPQQFEQRLTGIDDQDMYRRAYGNYLRLHWSRSHEDKAEATRQFKAYLWGFGVVTWTTERQEDPLGIHVFFDFHGRHTNFFMPADQVKACRLGENLPVSSASSASRLGAIAGKIWVNGHQITGRITNPVSGSITFDPGQFDQLKQDLLDDAIKKSTTRPKTTTPVPPPAHTSWTHVTADPIGDIKAVQQQILRAYDTDPETGKIEERDLVARRQVTLPRTTFPELPYSLADVRPFFPWEGDAPQPGAGEANWYTLDPDQIDNWKCWNPGAHFVDSSPLFVGDGTCMSFFLLTLEAHTKIPRLDIPAPFRTWLLVCALPFDADSSLVRLVLPDGQELALLDKAIFEVGPFDNGPDRSLTRDDLRKRVLKELGYHYLSDEEMDTANRDAQTGKTLIAAKFWEDQHPDMTDFRQEAANHIGQILAGQTLEEL